MNSSRKEYALIVAGGKGTRLKSPVPKQFMELAGKPVLLHTLEAFIRYSPDITLLLVLAPDDIGLWSDLSAKFGFAFPLRIVPGGNTRFQSVRNGLAEIPENGLVAIHDGVRPLVSADLIGASFRLATLHGNAVASVRLKESVRVIDQESTRAVDRSKYRLIQTPQTFDVHLIRAAYKIDESDHFTDDASVAEHAGHVISLFEGSYDNIKVTTEEDFLLAEAILRKKNNERK